MSIKHYFWTNVFFFFTEQDHVEIAKIVKELNYPWVVTYDNVDEIKTIYSFNDGIEYELSYTVEKKYIGSEIMFYRQDLDINI